MASRLAIVRGAPLKHSLSPGIRSVPFVARRGVASATTPRQLSQTSQAEADGHRRSHAALESLQRDPAYLEMKDAQAENPQPWMDFVARHIGPRDSDIDAMLKTVGADSLDTFISQVIPKDILLPPKKTIQPKKLSDTIRVMHGRAEGFGINIEVMDLSAPDAHDKIKAFGDDLVGVMVQYPDTNGGHIRREKATSNVCTAQALLANMSAMYAIYHGPGQLREMAVTNLRHARMIQAAAQHYGLNVITSSVDPEGRVLSDTVTISFKDPIVCRALRRELNDRGISSGKSWSSNEIVLAVPTTFTLKNFVRIVQSFRDVSSKNHTNAYVDVANKYWTEGYKVSSNDIIKSLPDAVRRESKFLTHPVFNSHHSETEMLRYMHHLQSKDLSLVHSMIPLGSCTMKLNGTTQMELIGTESSSNIHPHAPVSGVKGYQKLFAATSAQLAALTGMDATSLQPNSGAQGEFAGLRAIAKYHEEHNGGRRDICLIPTSAHGTNPASAAMAGLRVVPIKCDTATGNLDIADLQAKAKKHEKELAAIMITYPSTYGVFEPEVRKACDIVHEHGGLVYMDGANMNAQIGLTSPGALGADVCHLNLHKTFCIPHGGGGPGIGPICVKDILEPYLPHQNNQTPVSSASFGSASIVPISWAYISTMGDAGLRKATSLALLNANYILTRLKEHYPILYTNENGRCAHEFIIDARGFSKTAGVEAIDIAKRLQDYGFHAPTMSWPVPNTLMIEPTESESKEELDRFINALISIRNEIREVEEGKQPREGNVLKNAPHTQIDLLLGDNGKWERPYSREKAAYPLPYLTEKKFWPTVTRVDDKYGDTNLFCTCPPVEDTTGTN
ncbi:putative glycine dehydrogenase (decarboxylating), mitochondrial [Beauveria bassiana]|nr:putative glycine dehydrogenase (decarboxylating), mitochondrial [Beauveria bassiana]